MRPKIGLVHALHASIAPIESAFSELWPEAETVSLYDQSLYLEFNRSGVVTARIVKRIESLLALSADSGVQAILFTGSLFGDAVEAARPKLEVPVLTAYEAMIEEAFDGPSAPRLGVLTTAAGTGSMVQADIEKFARSRSLEYEIDLVHVAGAIDALLAGDRARHDELVLAAAAKMQACDALLLSQFSMAPVSRQLPPLPGRRVLTSPGSAVAKIRRLVAK